MAMALPVYAEVDLLPDAPDEVELLEDEQGTASGEDTTPPEQNAATPEPEQSAEPEQPAPTETPEPTAEPALTPEPAATATATPVPTVTPTATPEPTEQPQKMYAARSVDNVQAVSEKANGSFVLYFMAPSSWGTLADGQEVWCYGEKQSPKDGNATFDKKVDGTETGVVSGTKRAVYKITLTAIADDKNSDCPYGGFYNLRFYVKDVSGKVSYVIKDGWQNIDEYKGKCYDGEKGKWTDFVAYDPNNHLSFAGNKMVFENLSESNLANVTAVFYEKDGDTLKEVKTVMIGNVAASKKLKFKIPNVECSYVQFFADDKRTKLSVVYNFYDQETENAFQYDASDKYCYTYTAENTGSWGTPHGGSEVVSEVVYFDSTLSSYAYAGDDDSKKNSMPTTQDGDSGKMYCYFENDQGNYSDIIDMTKIPPETGSSRELWSATIPKGYTYTKVRFSGRKVTPSETGEKIAQKYDLTDMQEIPTDLNEPCFFADDGDDKTYWGTDVNRDGYWGEKNDVRDAEAGKDSTVVDITSDYSRGNSKGIKYITSTLYDYYTDYELNGNNRDNYATDPAFSTYRIQVPFRQFDQAVSDYYRNYKNASSILYPIYTGHFQCADNHHFSGVAEGLGLFGWSERGKNESKYKSFMAANNSEIDEDSGSGKYEFAFLGIVGNKLDSNGNLLMRESNGTDGTGLVEPHFNEAFLNGENSKNTKLGQVYKNVEFPFTQKQIFKDEPGVNYWWYDAAKTSLYLRKDNTTGAYYLGNGNGDGSTVDTLSDNSKNKDSQSNDTPNGHGFFPFNETVSSVDVRRYNYGYGAKLKIPFTLTEDGTVLDKNNKEQSIKFYFSGDDDVWVFIDGQLVLDIGGAHGKAAGIIDFDQRGTNKNKVTAYVSKVKYNNVTKKEYGAGDTTEKKTIVYTGNDLKGEKYNPTNYYYSNTVDIPNLSTGQHTLTMYYMERGMWESNMAVAFNFPDNNELQVQKEVDLNKVDPDFKNCFTDQKIFNFTIQNQATHYGEKVAAGSDTSGTKEVNFADCDEIKPATDSTEGEYIFKLDTNPEQGSGPEGEKVLHWYARYTDTEPVSAARKKRYGILTLKNPIDIKDERFLTFQVYVDPGDSGGDLSLNNLYLELLDENDVQKGSLGTSGINGATYGSVEVKTGAWVTVKLDLNKMKAQDGFNGKVKTIRVGDNYSRHIYFRNFTFIPKAVPKTMTGFTTDQKEIPDYGSATSGQLQNAINAQYTSTKDSDTQLVDDDGRFVLEDGETVTFSDQFRRGSYISLKEELNRNLYDTTWTVCENGQAVTSMKGDSESVTVTDTNKSLDKQEGSSPNDGRTEKIRPNDDQTGNSYTGNKPSADTIVFRSYKDPDENSSTLTKLKVKYVNTVKTGGLKIQKKAAEGEEGTINGTYTFKVTFNDVGGEGLEKKDIIKYVEINMSDENNSEHTGTITGIPVGTRYTIEEVKTDDSRLQSVTVPADCDSAHVINNNTMVEGVIKESNDPKVTAIFTNTRRKLINIEFDKLWKDANGTDLSTANQPDKIRIQLQRRLETSTNDADWTPVKYPTADSPDYVTITRGDNGWQFTFSNLDQYPVDDTNTNYQYRIVEGTVDDKGKFTQANGTITINGNTYVVTAEATAKSEKDSETGATTTPATATDGTITGGSGNIVLTNKLQNPKFVLDIIKKDAEPNNEGQEVFLKGVEFKLEKLKAGTTGGTQWEVDASYKFDNNDNLHYLTGTTGDYGKITNNPFKDLKPGRYRLTETKAHPGYNLLSKSIDIEFTQDGKYKIDDGTAKNATGDAASGYTVTLTVLNRKTPELPHTGADAPSLWLLIGMPLAVAGLLIFTFRYNRKGGRRH